jgi:hypothetical protein
LVVCVHHYIAGYDAVDVLRSRQAEALSEIGEGEWFKEVEFTFGCVFTQDLPIDRSSALSAQNFVNIAKKYCDREDSLLNNKHFEEGGTKDPALGFADCALPVILDHNTPNNSVALLWAETSGGGGISDEPNRHAMRPLFRRRQRHT